ncbi:hypothetical protein BH23ACT12_BH23ACT12_21580 [soil metagenome]
MADSSARPSADFAQLFVESLSIRNFRGIENLTLELEPGLTLLVGRNNSGKSRILRALAIALGSIRAEADDLTVDGPKKAEIDVVLAPLGDNKDGAQRFEVPVAARLELVQPISEAPIRERFAWRTAIRGGSKEGYGVNADRTVLIRDVQSQKWVDSLESLGDRGNIVAAGLIDTNRDLAVEIGKRGSAIRRVLDDLEIADTERSGLEAELNDLGSRIVDASRSLRVHHKLIRAVYDSRCASIP